MDRACGSNPSLGALPAPERHPGVPEEHKAGGDHELGHSRPGSGGNSGAHPQAQPPLARGARTFARAVIFEVEDNGRGISETDLGRIFDLFRRGGKQDKPGEGIGLAHLKVLIRRLGGKISCRSVLGQGSVFSVLLPHAQASATSANSENGS